MNELVKIEGFMVEVRRSSRRRTVDLIVDRFGSLVASIPDSLEIPELENIIRKKELWIHSTLAKKEKVLHPRTEKEYVTGEGFYYRGRKYRLKLIDADRINKDMPVLQLKDGRFILRRDAVGRAREHFVQWYTKQAQKWISKAVYLLKERVAASPRSIGVRDLKFRWGSCTSNGDLYFHWRVMLLPPKVITYLILHELVHLHEHNHGPAFYQRLERAVPDYLETEAWLKKNGDFYLL